MEEIESKEIGIQWITMPFDFYGDMNMMISEKKFKQLIFFFFLGEWEIWDSLVAESLSQSSYHFASPHVYKNKSLSLG